MSITVYLDTANWYDLAEGRINGDRFERAVRHGTVIPVLSFIHLIEFAQTDPRYRDRVTAYLDSFAKDKAIWIKLIPAVAQAELHQSFLRFNGIDPGPLNVFGHTLVDTLTAQVRGLDRAEARTYSITKLVEIISGLPHYRRHQWFRRFHMVRDIARLQYSRLRTRVVPLPSDTEYVRNILSDMPRTVITPLGIAIDITPEWRQQFLSQLRWVECPAITLRVALMRGWGLGSGGGDPSDFEDLFHIVPPLAYCDVLFADRRTCSALLRGRASKFPRKNADLANWINSL